MAADQRYIGQESLAKAMQSPVITGELEQEVVPIPMVS